MASSGPSGQMYLSSPQPSLRADSGLPCRGSEVRLIVSFRLTPRDFEGIRQRLLDFKLAATAGPIGRIAGHPPVHRLAGHAMPLGDLAARLPGLPASPAPQAPAPPDRGSGRPGLVGQSGGRRRL